MSGWCANESQGVQGEINVNGVKISLHKQVVIHSRCMQSETDLQAGLRRNAGARHHVVFAGLFDRPVAGHGCSLEIAVMSGEAH